MTTTPDPAAPTATSPGKARRLVLPLALATAAAGLATGMLGGPLFTSPAGPSTGAPALRDAGTFPIAFPGTRAQRVQVSVAVRPGASAPQGESALRDAVLVLLTEATALPLVLDGRTSLPDLERIALSIAPASAPWLDKLILTPDAAEPAIAPEARDPAQGGH